MTEKSRMYKCKACGALLGVIEDKAELEMLDLFGEWWVSDLCMTCRFHEYLNNGLANRRPSGHEPFGSPPEERLWNALSKEFEGEGVHIFNQVWTVFSCTLDFYFPAFRLAVEVDGKEFHNKCHDEWRDAEHRKYGIETLRFWANEVCYDMPSVLSRIRGALHGRSKFAFPPKRRLKTGDEAFLTGETTELAIQDCAMSSFEFLRRIDVQLFDLAHQAERLCKTDPNGAVTKLRMFAESIAKSMAPPKEASGNRAETATTPSLFDILSLLEQQDAIPKNILCQFHIVRKLGNNGRQRHRCKPLDAQTALDAAHEIGVWFVTKCEVDRANASSRRSRS